MNPTATPLGSPTWYDREIDWLAANPHRFEDRAEPRRRIMRLTDLRNAVARRYSLPERRPPTWALWETAVQCRINLQRLLREAEIERANQKWRTIVGIIEKRRGAAS